MNENQKIRFELIETHKVFEFLYYLEVIYPKTDLQKDFSNSESGKIAEMLWNHNLNKCDKLFECIGILVENKQSEKDSEYFLLYIESEIKKLKENKNIVDHGEDYIIWMRKHFE